MTEKVVTFGEIMMRLSPPDFLRFKQARSFDVIYGGSEANVAVSLANFGVPVEYVTRLPDNDLGDACIQFLRQYGLGVDNIVRGGERLGLYFLEVGAIQRRIKVIYDRANSALATIEPGMMNWQQIFAQADWFHWSGITPAISAGAADVCREAVQIAADLKLTISCDLNYRQQLWKWGKSAGEVMPSLMRYCHVLLGNKNQIEQVLKVKIPKSDKTADQTNPDKYRDLCQQLTKQFPSLQTIAITLRDSISASHHTWSGVLWHKGKFYTGPTYDLTNIVDRVGGGDAFMGALIYGLRTYGEDGQKVLNFALAASSLKHSIFGDFNLVTIPEVENLMVSLQDGQGLAGR